MLHHIQTYMCSVECMPGCMHVSHFLSATERLQVNEMLMCANVVWNTHRIHIYCKWSQMQKIVCMRNGNYSHFNAVFSLVVEWIQTTMCQTMLPTIQEMQETLNAMSTLLVSFSVLLLLCVCLLIFFCFVLFGTNIEKGVIETKILRYQIGERTNNCPLVTEKINRSLLKLSMFL